MILHKYNGCGNDFILMDYEEGIDYHQLASKWCGQDRFDTDGLIVVREQPLTMLYFNKDGSQAPMCGNGIRCFARHVWDKAMVETSPFDVHTLAGVISIEILTEEPFYCSAQMGQPDYSTEKLAINQTEPIVDQIVRIGQVDVQLTSLFMGTIHTVVFVEDAKAQQMKALGEQICHHPLFSEKTNVNFVQRVNEQELIVRTYERGVGWTLACGTGCCAAYVVARDHGYLASAKAMIHLEQGELMITGETQIQMTGPAVHEWSQKEMSYD